MTDMDGGAATANGSINVTDVWRLFSVDSLDMKRRWRRWRNV
jgi:hypothetical protein